MIKINEIYKDLINKFPADIDPNRVFKDVTAETKPLVDEYYRLYNANDLDGASLLIQNNPVLQDMIVNSYVIQYLYDMNISTQRFYMNDVQQYLVNIVAYKNDFDLTQKYTKYNVVNYMVNGAKEAFMCVDKNIPIGILPTNTTYWVSLTLRGEQGASGTGLAWRGSWNNTITYHKDDCVSYNNVLWAAKRESLNRVPQDISDDWEYALKLDIRAQDVICRDGNTVEKKISDLNSTKADKTYLDTKLTEQKTHVDTELAKKAKQTYVDSELSTKSEYNTATCKVNPPDYDIDALHRNLVKTQDLFDLKFIPPTDFDGKTLYVFDGGKRYTLYNSDGEKVQAGDGWKANVPVTITFNKLTRKAFFKQGGSGVNQTLPPQIRSFAVIPGNAQNKLSWLLPVDTTAYEGLTIVRKIGSAPTKLSDGTKISLSKTATSYTDTGLTNDTKYYYRAFPYNAKKQYQTDIVGAVAYGTPVELNRSPLYGVSTRVFYTIDPNTLSILSSIENPYANIQGIGGIQGRLYCCNTYPEELYELNPETLLIIKTANAPDENVYGIGGIQNRLYCLSWGSGSRSHELDINTLIVIKTVDNTQNVAYSGIGGMQNRLYRCTSVGNRLEEIDPNTLSLIKYVTSTIINLDGMGGIQNRLYASNTLTDGSSIYELDPNTLLNIKFLKTYPISLDGIGGTK